MPSCVLWLADTNMALYTTGRYLGLKYSFAFSAAAAAAAAAAVAVAVAATKTTTTSIATAKVRTSRRLHHKSRQSDPKRQQTKAQNLKVQTTSSADRGRKTRLAKTDKPLNEGDKSDLGAAGGGGWGVGGGEGRGSFVNAPL